MKASQLDLFRQIQWIMSGIFTVLMFGYVICGFSEDPDICIASEKADRRIVLNGASKEDWEQIINED